MCYYSIGSIENNSARISIMREKLGNPCIIRIKRERQFRNGLPKCGGGFRKRKRKHLARLF